MTVRPSRFIALIVAVVVAAVAVAASASSSPPRFITVTMCRDATCTRDCHPVRPIREGQCRRRPHSGHAGGEQMARCAPPPPRSLCVQQTVYRRGWDDPQEQWCDAKHAIASTPRQCDVCQAGSPHEDPRPGHHHNLHLQQQQQQHHEEQEEAHDDDGARGAATPPPPPSTTRASRGGGKFFKYARCSARAGAIFTLMSDCDAGCKKCKTVREIMPGNCDAHGRNNRTADRFTAPASCPPQIVVSDFAGRPGQDANCTGKPDSVQYSFQNVCYGAGSRGHKYHCA